MFSTIIEHCSFIFRYTAITGHTSKGGKTTATSGRRGTSAGVSMGLCHQITSLARSGSSVPFQWPVCGTGGFGSPAVRPAARAFRWAPGKYWCHRAAGAKIAKGKAEMRGNAPEVNVKVQVFYINHKLIEILIFDTVNLQIPMHHKTSLFM